jgi:hypothetical protein
VQPEPTPAWQPASTLCRYSGLYGVLRLLDRLQPYRLEIGTALANTAAPTSTPTGARPSRLTRRPLPALGSVGKGDLGFEEHILPMKVQVLTLPGRECANVT